MFELFKMAFWIARNPKTSVQKSQPVWLKSLPSSESGEMLLNGFDWQDDVQGLFGIISDLTRPDCQAARMMILLIFRRSPQIAARHRNGEYVLELSNACSVKI